MRRAEAAIAQARSLKRRPAADVDGPADIRPRQAQDVSDRLAAREARFRALVAVAGHATWTLDPSGAFSAPQPGWQTFTGQRHQESLSSHGYGWLDVVHPEDRDATAQAFTTGLESGRMFEHQCRLRRASEIAGYEWRHSLMRAVPVRDAHGGIREWVIANTDVTEYVQARDHAESMLREREDHYRHAVELNPQIAWTANAHGYVFDVSPRWYSFTGFPRTASRRSVWREVEHPDDRALVRAAWSRALAAGEPLDVEHRIRIADGTYRYMRSRAAPRRDEHGRITLWYGTTEDVDARRRAERAEWLARREAERSRDEADVARRIAESAVAAKGRILAAASHDLRSPLDAITRYSDILREEILGPLTSAQRGVLDRIQSASGHLLALVNDILRAAEAESNEVEFTITDANVSTVCTMLEELVAPLAHVRGLRFECQTDGADREPIVARADPERLLQILMNLATNAIKFTPPGGAVFVVTGREQDGRVAVRVSDTGCGIPAEQHESIFHPFVQVSQIRPSTAEGGSGVGLGLATSRTLAQRMGGDITLSSEVGVGSVFSVLLPGVN